MPRVLRHSLLLAIGVASLFAAWRIVAITQADRWANVDPDRALRWIDRHPSALLEKAERQLREGQLAAAKATARKLVAVEPLEGRGFRVLGEIADREGNKADALKLYGIATRRSPRDLPARGWMIQHLLLKGDYAPAIEHIDVVMRISPQHRPKLALLLAQLAAEPTFAEKLVLALARAPAWRPELLSTLLAAEDPKPADAIFPALRRAGGLTDSEFDQWIAQLMRQGRWSDAYVRWVGTLELPDGRIPAVYNGDFELPISGRGFDWRISRIPGVSLEFVPDRNSKGLSAHASFRWRPVDRVNIEQPLLLAPGSYRFSSRVRADALRSEKGLEFSITCDGQAAPLASSERISGSFGWRVFAMDVVVPGEACQGQWLRVVNPAPAGIAQQISGDFWFDDLKIVPIESEQKHSLR